MGPLRSRLLVSAALVASLASGISLGRASRVHPSVTLLTPWVAPGDDVCFEVTFREGGRDVLERQCTGLGRDAEIGVVTTIPFVMDGPVDPYRPVPALAGDAPDVLEVDVLVLSPGERLLRRLAALLGAGCWIVLSVLFVGRVLAPRLRRERAAVVVWGGWGLAVAAGLLLTAKLAAHPLGAALGFGGHLTFAALTAAATLGTVVAGRWLAGPERTRTVTASLVRVPPESSGTYRDAGAGGAALDVGAVGAALRRAGHPHVADARSVVVRPGPFRRGADARVRLVTGPSADGVEVEFNDSTLLARVLRALVPVMGPMRLEVSHGSRVLRYPIERPADADAFVDGYRAAQRGEDR